MKKFIIYLLSFWMVQVSLAKNVNFDIVAVPYEEVEIKPLFPGGISEFMNYVMKNFHVPEEEEWQTGTLQISMVIDKEGNVTNVKVLKDVGGAGNEVKRVLSKCPKWQPGKMKGQTVDVEYTFPITIK